MGKLFKSKNIVVYFSILGILMFIGVSYAVWQFSFAQNNPNLAASALLLGVINNHTTEKRIILHLNTIFFTLFLFKIPITSK